MKSSHVLSAIALVGAVMSATPAMAKSILINGNPTVQNIGPSNNKFTYTPIVTATSSVVAGSLNSTLTTFQNGQADFFILVDFRGYIPGTAFAPSANWTITVAPTFGSNVSGTTYNVPTGTSVGNSQTFTDDPTISDILFSYTSGATIGGASNVNLGLFGGNSTFNQFTFNSILEAQDHAAPGGTIGNADLYFAPGVSSLGTPLPAAAWSGMSLLGVLGGAKLLRRRR